MKSYEINNYARPTQQSDYYAIKKKSVGSKTIGRKCVTFLASFLRIIVEQENAPLNRQNAKKI